MEQEDTKEKFLKKKKKKKEKILKKQSNLFKCIKKKAPVIIKGRRFAMYCIRLRVKNLDTKSSNNATSKTPTQEKAKHKFK